MFTINKDIILRNLEEQVQYLTEFHKVNQGFVQWGIRVVGQVDTAEELPNPTTYEGEYGDAYAVGYEAPFFFYIWTRASIVGESDYWFPFGEISIVGPQGPKGDKGDKGNTGESSKWFTGQYTPTAGMKTDDLYLNNSGEVYQYTNNNWQYVTNIRGAQGLQGIQGIQGNVGPVGPAGPKGEKGDVGGFINIAGQLTNVEQLPTPTSLGNLTIAYLVNQDLYIQIGQTSETAVWKNMGPLNVATLVTVDGQYQNVWDADTKLDKVTTTSGYPRAYVVKPDGSQGILTVSSNASPDTIVLRSVNGIISVGTPYNPEHAANKSYVDTEVDKCVKKVAADDFTRIYGVNSTTSDGSQTTFIASQDTLDDSVAIRVTGGQLNVGEPIITSHAATKGYVDTALENKVLYYHTIIGTATYSKNGAQPSTGSITLCFFSPIAKFKSLSDIASWVSTKFGIGFSGLFYGVPYGFIQNGIQISAIYANSKTELGCYGQILTSAGVQSTIITADISSITSFKDIAVQIL